MAYKFKFFNARTKNTIEVKNNCFLTALEIVVDKLGWIAPKRRTVRYDQRDGWMFTNKTNSTQRRFYDLMRTPSYYDALESFVKFQGYEPMNQNANDVMGAFAGNDVVDHRRGLRAWISRTF